MSKQNTNVESLPTISQLGVQKLASKCAGDCGACLLLSSCGRIECAMLISAKG